LLKALKKQKEKVNSSTATPKGGALTKSLNALENNTANPANKEKDAELPSPAHSNQN
jgi:hypothetical protein